MKKKIAKVLLASFIVIGLATVSYATPGSGQHNFNQQETVDSAVKKIIQLCAFGQNKKKNGRQDNDRSAENNQRKEKVVVAQKDQPVQKDQKYDFFDKDGLTVCKAGKSCQDQITDNGDGAGWDSNPAGDNPVPEPATMLLLGAGIAGIAGVRLRKKNK